MSSKKFISAEDIPSIAELYKLTELKPYDDTTREVPAPSQSYNDRIGIIRGDITKLAVDAIVNAANNSLLGGGGVDGAIHRAAGPDLLEECRTLDGCATGSAKITDAYELPSKKVIHAVGPVYKPNDREGSERKLRGCYTTSLELAVANGCKSIAFSALSTGVYGYPSQSAAPIAIKAVRDFIESKDGDKLEKIVFTTFEKKDVLAYNESIPQFFPPTEQDLSPDDWEEIQGGETAENGDGKASEADGKVSDDTEPATSKSSITPETEVATDVGQDADGEQDGSEEPAAKKVKTSHQE